MAVRQWFIKWRGFILLPISFILCLFLYPLAIAWSLAVCLVRGNVWESVWEVSEKQFILALANDKYANVMCGDLFNSLLITKEAPVKFGLIIQTISAVLGHNQNSKTLTAAGRWLVKVLDSLDPGHCKRAAEQDKYYKAYENWK